MGQGPGSVAAWDSRHECGAIGYCFRSLPKKHVRPFCSRGTDRMEWTRQARKSGCLYVERALHTAGGVEAKGLVVGVSFSLLLKHLKLQVKEEKREKRKDKVPKVDCCDVQKTL